MPALLFAVLSVVGFASGFFVFQSDQAVIAVANLEVGEVLKGIVQIQGTIQNVQFSRYEVAFAYSSDRTDTWFLIAEGSQPVQDGILASWDTSRITDGDYRLRVLVVLSDGATRELIVPDLRVRNYTPVEPAPAQPDVSTPTATMTPGPPALTPTATAEIANQANPTERDFVRMVGCGASASVLLFAISGLYLTLSRRMRGR